jgi:hypothetical protein
MACPITIALASVDKYQTLIAGLLALFGAWLTVRKLTEQIRQAETLEADRRERRNLAARTVMPATLTELIEYAMACIHFLGQFHPRELGQVVAPEGVEAPRVPAEALLNLRECVQFGDEIVAEVIADMMSQIQIQHSRLASITRPRDGEIILPLNIEVCLVDAVEVYARASKLFPYARRVPDAAPATPTIEDLRASVWHCHFDPEKEQAVQERIGRWIPNQQRASFKYV